MDVKPLSGKDLSLAFSTIQQWAEGEDVWVAWDARCGVCPEGQRPFLGLIYVNPQLGAGYFARSLKRKGRLTGTVPGQLPGGGYPLAPLPGSRTWLKPPGPFLRGWFETKCPKGAHAVGALAEELTTMTGTVYLLPRPPALPRARVPTRSQTT